MSVRGAGAVEICVDEYDGGEIRGRVYSSSCSEPENFYGVLKLVKTLNDIFDKGDYPQATMRCRGFKAEDDPEAEAQDNGDELNIPYSGMSVLSFGNIHGKRATFKVNVLFRQNASWQGTLTWLEGNVSENFRSVLEMMMLIDSAFEAAGEAVVSDSESKAMGD